MARFVSFVAILALVVTFAAGAALAQGYVAGTGMGMRGDAAFGCDMMGGGMMGGGMMGSMLCGMADDYDWDSVADSLRLTADQKDKLMMQNRDTVRKMMESRNQFSLKMFDLNTELRKANPDQGAIDKLVDEMASLQKQILKQRVMALQQMRATFTPGQWKRFKHMPMMRRTEEMPMMEGRRRMHMMQ